MALQQIAGAVFIVADGTRASDVVATVGGAVASAFAAIRSANVPIAAADASNDEDTTSAAAFAAVAAEFVASGCGVAGGTGDLQGPQGLRVA